MLLTLLFFQLGLIVKKGSSDIEVKKASTYFDK